MIMEADDRIKIRAMKQQTKPNGEKRYSLEFIARYTGFTMEQVKSVDAPTFSATLGRPRSLVTVDEAGPIASCEQARFQRQAARSSAKLLAAIQAVSSC